MRPKVTMPGRRQLSLFVPEPDSKAIEAVRRVVDPVQFGLISAHATLCREDELDTFAGWERRLGSICDTMSGLTLRFGRAEAFSGHGIMLPCIEGVLRFRDLRRSILGSDVVRDAHPHLTLAHPRNPKAPGNAIEAAWALPASFETTFRAIVLIEQIDGGRWNLISEFPFRSDRARIDRTAWGG